MSAISPFDDSIYESQAPSHEEAANIPVENIEEVGRTEDGSPIFDVKDENKKEEKRPSEDDFYANLALELDDASLRGLAGSLLEEIKEDLESRKGWEKTINLALKYLGHAIEEDRTVPFLRACAAFDSTLSSAVLTSYSVARAELFPASGPARAEIEGMPTPENEDQGERVKYFLNYFLTKIDRGYYPDSDRLLMYLILCGSAVRKVYQDPILGRPNPRFIKPQDFIINHNAISVLDSTRLTERILLSKKDIILKERSGDFTIEDTPDINEEEEPSSIAKTIKKIEGVSTDAHQNKSLFDFYEVHVELTQEEVEGKKLLKSKTNKKNKKEKDLPKPYVVMIDVSKKKVRSIKRNWKEKDEKYKRLECFVLYQYLTGFGIYGLGLAHLMGSNAIVLTQILRQSVDAAVLQSFPGGIKTRGMKAENNDKAIGPTEFLEVETGGQPIRDCFMLMPYAGPSQPLLQLRNEIKQETAQGGSAAEAPLPENGTNTPVGTTLAMLEVANRVQSSVLRSLHVSLGYELQLIFNLFAEYLEDEPYPFSVPGKDVTIMRQDFNDKVSIMPVSDPNVLTSTHRLLRTEAELKLAQSAPEIYDMKEAHRRMLRAMNVEGIEKLIPDEDEPQALDPTTENIFFMNGKPITVGSFQDDEAHLIVHRRFLEEIQNNPQLFNLQVINTIKMHIQKHEAYKIYKQLKQYMNVHIKEEEIMSNHQIQNMLAMQDAQNVMQIMQQEQQQQQEAAEAQKNQLDPNAVMMADIEQHREASHLKDEEAKLKAETEAFKAQLKFESETSKIEADKEMAVNKNEVDLTIAHSKQPTQEPML
jgi:hypothetical protein